MNNPDLELHEAFIKAEIEPPYGKSYVPTQIDPNGNAVPEHPVIAYSTDELWRILPKKIEGYEKALRNNGTNEVSEYRVPDSIPRGESYKKDCLIWFTDSKDPKTALTELLKWALKDHPDAVRLQIKEINNDKN